MSEHHHQVVASLLALFAGTALCAEGPAGGDTTVHDASAAAFSQPAANLRGERRTAFFVGNSFFNQNWVAAPASTAGRDGLGPLFNARSCSGCHFKDGRGSPPAEGEPLRSMILRISQPGPHGAPLPDPVYGLQIQGSALPGIPPEAAVRVDYEAIAGSFADGTPYELRRPRYRLDAPGYGPVSAGLRMSPRVAPAVIGLGLLEAIPEAALLEFADADDRDGDGISGRLNRVPDVTTGSLSAGRFGWKAEQPTVRQQVAAAFLGDMGLSTPLFPQANHTSAQNACAGLRDGGSPEVSEKIFDSVVSYCRALAVPAARASEDHEHGRGLFVQLQCAACHVPEWKTGSSPDFPELSGQTIHPYTDLLLHDLGEGLSDERPVFDASGREWRTPPLWGIGLIPKVNGHSFLLHDGRARNVTEAVLWHGGEAEAAREGFRALPKADRETLLRFIESL